MSSFSMTIDLFLNRSSEIRHEAQCNTCKAYPVIGMRYRCLRCFNYDLCQTYFPTSIFYQRKNIVSLDSIDKNIFFSYG
ncbi:unnamed protein product [Rotaria sp. Silwood1]|nr:unnamed protein product [Rotaria sp. Silwood1]